MLNINRIFNILSLCAAFGLSAENQDTQETKTPLEFIEEQPSHELACAEEMDKINPIEELEPTNTPIVCNDLPKNENNDDSSKETLIFACKDC